MLTNIKKTEKNHLKIPRLFRIGSAFVPRLFRVCSASDPHRKGFSLVEMLVAVAVFMSIMTIAISALISIINVNNKAQSIKGTVDSVTFAVEDMSRDLRAGTEYKCLGGQDVGETNDCKGGWNEIQYVNSSGDTITYTFNGSGDLNKGVLTKTDTSGIVDLISQDSKAKVDNIKFYVIGADKENSALQTERTQPRVIITVSGLISVKGSPDTTFNLQTNISQRIRR